MTNKSFSNSTSLFDELDALEAGFFFLETVLFIPTVFGNTLILICLRKYQWLRTPLNSLIKNLAAADLLIGVLLIPFDIVGTFFGLNRLRYVCLVQLAILVSLLLVSLFSMFAISVERYLSVAFPWQHRATKRHNYVRIFVPICWTISIGFSIIPLLGIHDFIDGKSRCHLTLVWPQEMRVTLSSIVVIVVITKITLYSLVVNIALGKLTNFSEGGDHSRMRRKLAKTYILIAISAIFIICWAPYCIVTFFKIFFDYDELKIAAGWTILLVFINSGLNWLIYGLKNAKIRRAFKMLLCNVGEDRNSVEMSS
ncbi:tyramine receptor Ser-2-like [Ruditapes philippinarum]|uniref:tyramine receptor Ser-2-like n=1 Tax=Ruditapes philippinarum TaxID=129788 RepID=UPI00295B209B|nr:tyramine receptor Ser-2-like [Ruditapes philippinarum]